MSHRNYPAGGRIYSPHVKTVLIDCNFVVDSTNGNGLGIRSLKGPYVANVFMYTSATPAPGSPNPVAGTIVVQLQDNYNGSLSGFKALVSPVSGTALQIDNSALVAGTAYIITTLGDATAAQWQALGVPAGVVPAVGVSFVASSVGAGPATSLSRVMATAATGSGIMSIETVGDPNLSIAPDPTKNQGFGAQFILRARAYGGAIAAPADGTVISLGFYLRDSST
jgi:hypothetical protein